VPSVGDEGGAIRMCDPPLGEDIRVDGDRSGAPRGWDAHSRANESEVAVEDVVHRLHAVYLLQ